MNAPSFPPLGSRLLPLVLLTSLAACSDGSSPLNSDGGATSLSVSFAATGTATTTPNGSAVIVGSANDTLVVSRVELVLDEVKLKRSGVTSCPDSMSTSRDSSRSADRSGCSRLDLGPTLLDLPLSGTGTSPVSVTVPAGTYHEIEFELDDVSTSSGSSAAERAFLAAHPDLRDVSVRVTGTYRGTAFSYVSRPKAKVEFEFEPSIVIEAGVNDNVTIALDLGQWFKDAAGAVLAPTPANRVRIDANIMASFSAFGDRDRNGRGDEGRGRGRGRGRSSDD